MAESARVTSIDAIKDFRAALCRFSEDTKNALGAVEMEIRRVVSWVVQERPLYWQAEIKRRKEDLSDAQAALFQKRLQAGHGRQVHDSEQKEAMRFAQRRLHEAEEKFEIVKKWAPALQHEVMEYFARARPTGDMLDSDVTQALALLDRMATALDAYIAAAAPTFAPGETQSSAAVGEATSERSTVSAAPAEPGGPSSPAGPAAGQTTAVATGNAEAAQAPADESSPGAPA